MNPAPCLFQLEPTQERCSCSPTRQEWDTKAGTPINHSLVVRDKPGGRASRILSPPARNEDTTGHGDACTADPYCSKARWRNRPDCLEQRM